MTVRTDLAPHTAVLALALLAASLVVPALAPTPLAAQSRPTAKADKPKDGHDLPFLDDGAPPLDTLAFTVDEATWLSLSPTPDGARLVFEVLGDLYTLPIGGGQATRITSGMGYDSQPAVSPDGRWVAFVSDRDGADNVWIAPLDRDPDGTPLDPDPDGTPPDRDPGAAKVDRDPDGTPPDPASAGTPADRTAGAARRPRKLSRESQNAMYSPTWTPDSRYVIASKGGRGTTLWMYNIDGGSGFALGGGGSGSDDESGGGGGAANNDLGAVVSPDGRWLFYSTRQGNAAGGLPGWQIARRDMTTGDVDVITRNEWTAIKPALSPDGTKLVYGTRWETRTGLRIRDLDTGADEWLVVPVQRDQIETGGSPARDLLPNYAFTTDGRAVLYTEGGKIRRVDVDGGEVTTIPFTADVRLTVGPDLEAPYRVDQGPVRAKLAQSPRLSPDGRRVAMSVLTTLYVADLGQGGDADAPRALTPTRLGSEDAWAFKPAWSPDGRWIAYVTWATDGGHVWKRRSDGSGQPQRLTTVPAFYTDLAWSPDGTRLVGLRGNAWERNYTDSEFGGLRIPLDLVWLPADGGEVTTVVPARGVGAPHFVDDRPERIFVYSREGLLSMRWDGTDRRTHLKVTGRPNPRSPQPAPAEEVLMSPNGRWALASSANQLYVVPVPPPTGATPSVSVTGGSLPVEKLTDIGADYFAWADGGETITWAIGSTFYRRAFSTIDFGPDEDDAEPDEDDDAPADPSAPDAPSPEAPADSASAVDTDEDDAPDPPADFEDVEAYRFDVVVPRAVPEGSIVLRGANVITMAGTGDDVAGARENVDIVVTGNRIAEIGPSGSVRVPAGAAERDVGGRWIVPGFVDTHAHWEFRTHDVLEPHNWSLLANLAYGVTSGLDVQTSTNDYFAYQDLVETGRSVGQRAFMTGPGVFSSNNFGSYDEVLSYLKRYKEHYRTPNIKSYMVGNRKQRQWVVRAAYELGLMPTTEGGRNLRMDLTHAIDGFHGNEHTLPVIPLFEDVEWTFARTHTAYTPTLLVLYGGTIGEEWFYTQDGADVHDNAKLNRFTPHVVVDRNTRRRSRWVREDEHVFDDAAAEAADVQRAGGLVGVGGHGQLQGLGYHWEMWGLAMGGMTPTEVLRAATIDGARIIGIAQDLGSVAEGKLADLVILDANPLETIRNTTSIRWVMKNGELYEGDTLTRVWPSRRELPPLWWWDQAPTLVGETGAAGAGGR